MTETPRDPDYDPDEDPDTDPPATEETVEADEDRDQAEGEGAGSRRDGEQPGHAGGIQREHDERVDAQAGDPADRPEQQAGDVDGGEHRADRREVDVRVL